MNKRGSIFFGFAIALIIYVSGVMFIPFIVDDISTTRTALDCTNTSITGGVMLTCLTVDLVNPYLIWFFISVALGYLVGGTQQ